MNTTPMANGRLPEEITVLHCPRCGKNTGTELRIGDAVGYCRRCGARIRITIELLETKETAASGASALEPVSRS